MVTFRHWQHLVKVRERSWSVVKHTDSSLDMNPVFWCNNSKCLMLSIKIWTRQTRAWRPGIIMFILILAIITFFFFFLPLMIFITIQGSDSISCDTVSKAIYFTSIAKMFVPLNCQSEVSLTSFHSTAENHHSIVNLITWIIFQPLWWLDDFSLYPLDGNNPFITVE